MRGSMLSGSLVLGSLLVGCLILVKVTKESKVVDHPIVENLVRSGPLPPLKGEWKKVLYYIPKNDSQDCRNLFTSPESRSIKFLPRIVANTIKLSEQTKMKLKPPQAISEIIKMYQELARLDFIKTICEVEITDGQRTVAFLSTKPAIKVHIFDSGKTASATKMATGLKEIFPKQVSIQTGQLVTQVSGGIAKGLFKPKCDIISFNGGKDNKKMKEDLANMKVVAAKRNIIITDDIYSQGVNSAWNELNATKVISRLFDCRIPGTSVDIALGYYNF